MNGATTPTTTTTDPLLALIQGARTSTDDPPQISEPLLVGAGSGPGEQETTVIENVSTSLSPVNDATAARLSVTRFTSVENTDGKFAEMTRAEVVAMLQGKKVHSRKEDAPLVKLGRFANDSRKAGTSVLQLSAVMGDYDGETVSVDEAVRRLSAAGVSSLVYPTGSHRPQAPRWRVVAWVAKPIAPADYFDLVSLLNGALGGILGRESWDASRIYYFGPVQGVEYVVEEVKGLPLDILDIGGDIEPIGKRVAASGGRARASTVRSSAIGEAGDDSEFERQIKIASATSETMIALRHALAVLSLDDRELWVNIGQALHTLGETEFADQAHELWLQRTHASGRYRDGDEHQWDGFKPHTLTHKSIFTWADEADVASGAVETWRDRARAENAEAKRQLVEDDAQAIIEQLRKLTAAEVLRKWPALAAGLTKGAAQQVIDEVHRLTTRGKNALKADLADARSDAAREQRQHALRARADGRCMMEYQPDAKTVQADEVERAMMARARSGSLVCFGGLLAQIATKAPPFTHAIDDAEGEAPAVPLIVPLSVVDALGQAERAVMFYEVGETGPRAIGVPQQVIEVLVKKRDHVAPIVTGLAAHPLVLPSGEILSEPGRHEQTGIFMATVSDIIGLRPYSQDEARAALHRLRELTQDGFEFATALDADVALAGLFTAVERRVLPQAPGLAVVASTQSSGKTTLVRLIHGVVTGHDLPVSTFALGDEAEVRKHLLAMLMTSPELVCFDNVGDGLTIRSGVLAAVMTSPVFTDRLLGASQTMEVPTNTLFTLTGNNLSFGADESQRWLVSRLAPAGARPQERTFAHRDVMAWVRSIRDEVLRHVIGIVAGYAATAAVSALAGVRFTAWDRLVRRPLVWAGGADMADAFRANEKSSEELSAHLGLLELLREVFGDNEFRAGHVVDVLHAGAFDTGSDRLHSEAFRAMDEGQRDELLGSLREALGALRVRDLREGRQIGFALKTKRDSVVATDDGTLVLRGRETKGSFTYSVVEAGR